MSAERRLEELKLELPPGGKPLGVYRPFLWIDGLLYTSGHGPVRADKSAITGRLGADLDVETGKAAARQAGLAILATVREALGSLDRVKRLVKTVGFVNSASDFNQQPAVMNGFSELMAEVFGPDLGVGARSAVGVAALPGNWSVEVEAIFEVG